MVGVHCEDNQLQDYYEEAPDQTFGNEKMT